MHMCTFKNTLIHTHHPQSPSLKVTSLTMQYFFLRLRVSIGVPLDIFGEENLENKTKKKKSMIPQLGKGSTTR